jgi:ankyrin repeat protein
MILIVYNIAISMTAFGCFAEESRKRRGFGHGTELRQKVLKKGDFSGSRRGSLQCTKDSITERHGLSAAHWNHHAAALQSVAPLWRGKDRAWAYRKARGLYQSSSESSSGVEESADASAPTESSTIEDEAQHCNISTCGKATSGAVKGTQVSGASHEDSGKISTLIQPTCSSYSKNVEDLPENGPLLPEEPGVVVEPEDPPPEPIPDHIAAPISNTTGKKIEDSKQEMVAEDSLDGSRSVVEAPSQKNDGQTVVKVSYTMDDLVKAIYKNRRNQFTKILVSGLQINPVNANITPLMCACVTNKPSMVKALLEAGAKIDIQDAEGKTPLISCSQLGHSSMVDCLIKWGANLDICSNIGYTALGYAIQTDNDDISETLILSGCCLDYREPSKKATALMMAAVKAKKNIVQQLISSGAASSLQDYKGRTALMICLARKIKCKSTIGLLIEASNRECLDIVDFYGQSALMYAISNQMDFAVEKLMQKGCDCNILCPLTGKSPLILAIEGAREKIFSLLLEYGASVDYLDDSGKTALMYAAQLGYSAMVAALIEKGANVLAVHEETQFTPLYFAAFYNQNQSVRLLMHAEGKSLPKTSTY